MITGLQIKKITDECVTVFWDTQVGATSYNIYWADKNLPSTRFKYIANTEKNEFTLQKATHVPHYIKVSAIKDGKEIETSKVLKTDIHKRFNEQIETLSRGLIAIKAENGVFLSWRLFLHEVNGYNKLGLTGLNFHIYKNGEKLAYVTNSTNYIDHKGTIKDRYKVAAVMNGSELEVSKESIPWNTESNYIDIPLRKPEDGITPVGEHYTYSANDMSVGDIDGDGEYEFFVKWDPSNSHDVSHKGYTGNCFLDCYKLDGTLLWRLDMGVNIRAGAHYTQFMVYDFDGDNKAEIAIKTAPGTNITTYNPDGTVLSKQYITIPEKDIEQGVCHTDDYRMSSKDYYNHIVWMFRNWHGHPEVLSGNWPKTLEECFGIDSSYSYPLNENHAKELADYFIHEYAPNRSQNNDLSNFEGFILDGPEYLTMFSGEGTELETIPFKYTRVDDGLLWGDYAMDRIEPGNRVDRFLSGVAYLDGKKPYLIICRGYYTRATIVAYQFIDGHFKEYWSVDSGFVPMKNPFNDNPHMGVGNHPIYGRLAGQGNHSLSTADIDCDGCHEIIYGAAVIDQDGRLLYSSYGYLPDGTYAKLGHGDAMHVADIDPDRPGLEIFNVFEAGKYGPFGYALRDGETGEVIYGEYADKDLGRCMIGDIKPCVRGLETWVNKVQSCTGERLDVELPGTNQSIRWAADMSTQVIDGSNIFASHNGVIQDITHGIMLNPEGVMTNNGTKGNPCLVADIFGDWREELLLRTKDSSAIRIYSSTEITTHKLFTLMHDIQYRCSIAWQNNCYNQPGYTKFYMASDTDWEYVIPGLEQSLIRTVKKSYLHEKDAIIINNINEGFQLFDYVILYGEDKAYKEFLHQCYILNDSNNVYGDFYYQKLSKDEKNNLIGGLSDYEKNFIQTIEYTDDVYYPLSEEFMDFLLNISVREQLFSTFYFTKYPCTIWSNYNLEFPIFFKDTKDKNRYVELALQCGLQFKEA